MNDALQWLADNDRAVLNGLADLVSIPSISNDGAHAAELDRSAARVADQMRKAGLGGVEVVRFGGGYPYVYGERLDAPGKPTVFLYAHHDVQPINYVEQWKSDPWTLTERDGRLFARGAADDKGAITAQLAAIESLVRTAGRLPVNVKMLVEGEEEIGSRNLLGFFKAYRERIRSDVIVVCDTENLKVGLPSLTYSLRGVVNVRVEVAGLELPVHSGMVGGAVPDAALGLNKILSRLCWDGGAIPIPGFYDRVRPLSDAEKAAMAAMPLSADELRKFTGMLPGTRFAMPDGVSFCEATWRRPAVTVIAQEAGTIRTPSNQVLPHAAALVSMRLVPNQKPAEAVEGLRKLLTADVPWGLKVTVESHDAGVEPWMTDPRGPAFSAAMSALKSAYGVDPVGIGCGGSIGFVGPLAELFDGAPALLLGIEDPESNAHAPNESLHAGDFRRLMAALVHLFGNLASLERVK
jgi:acetylornithine deacetylase/succinyl-diaminopimelate desuccinylase-like protein